ncbi:MAG: hypothetical protein HUN04_20435 [Desulfobacter sp.]|nr:MAG: hypothetical protein HUN04_20435 [Desulfobacter sp.]
MAAQVHVYSKIERQLTDMMRQSNGRADAPAIAAQRAREIIDRLVQGITPTSCGLMKPRADRRLKNSLKFNLGSGFRLICIKEKPDIHIMFVGDHDSCDAWLDHHTRKKPHKTTLEADTFKVIAAAARPAEKTILPDADQGFDDTALFSDISQEDLRRVFSGLCSAG